MRSVLPKVLLVIAFLYSIVIVYNQFEFFGLSYDESLFINAAIQKDPITFISKNWHGIPIMVMQYIGALKSWIYYPIFKVFGVNIISIRLPMVLLMYVNFFLIYKIAIKYFDRNVVISLLILLFTDFTFINLHKIDHGPTAIETFLKLLSIYFICRKPSFANSFIIFIILLLGVFNKLNFIWFVNALFGTYFIFNFKKLFNTSNFKSALKNSLNKSFFINTIFYIFVASFFVLLIISQNIKPDQPAKLAQVIEQAAYQFHLMILTISNMRYQYLLGWSFRLPAIFLPVTYYTTYLFVIVIILINVFWLLKKEVNLKTAHFQVFTLIFLITIQYFYTKEASNMWHVLLLYPFIHLFVLNTIFIFAKNNVISYKIIFGGFASFLIGFNVYTYYDFQQKIGENCNYWLYDPSIYKLNDYTQNRHEKNIISLGYGVHSQLLVLDKKGKSYLEIIGNPSRSSFVDILDYNKQYFTDINNTLVVENIRANLNLKRLDYKKMLQSLETKGYKMELLKVINDGCGDATFNVFKVGRK